MPLYFTKTEKEAIRRKFISSDWWQDKAIVSKIDADNERLDLYRHCSHVPTTYTGKKTCCALCGSFFKKGMGEEWTINPPIPGEVAKG